MQLLNLKTLHERVINETDDLLKKAREDNITFSDLLDKFLLKDPDKNDGSNAINKLLQREDIYCTSVNGNLGSKLSDVLFSDKKYLHILLITYLDNLYRSCFEGTDTRVGINDLIAYEKPITNFDHRPIQSFDDELDKLDDNDYNVIEGHMIPAMRLKMGENHTLLRNIILGTELSYEFIKNSDIYIFEFADYILKIGRRHNEVLIKKFCDIFLADVDVRNIKFSNSIKNKTIEGINMWDYLGINKNFKDTHPADTVFGDDYATMKYLMTHNQAWDLREEINYISDKNYDTLFGVDKTIKALDESIIRENQLQHKFVIFNKESSLVLLTNDNDIHETYEYNSSYQPLFRQYFGRIYAFEEQHNAQRFIYEVA